MKKKSSVYPQIQVDFSVFYSSPLDVITDLLGVEPKKCRQTVVIPNPLYYWYMVTEQSHCRCLQEKFDEMIYMLGKLGAKVEVLQQLVKDYEIGVDFGGVVVMKNGDAPELCLSKETIALLASLNAQFGIALYEP